MQNNEIKITYSCEETLKKIKEYMADARSVTLYTSSLNSLTSYSNGIANEIISNLIFSKKRDKKEVTEQAEKLLERVGLLDKKNSYPRELSGGQKQRIAIIRSLCMNPEIMLFDEVEPEELMENTQVFEKADKITQMYILENIPKKLNYLDEQILVMTYGLDDKVYTEKEIARSLNIAKHNVKILKEKALNKLSIDMMRNDFVENSEEANYTVN